MSKTIPEIKNLTRARNAEHYWLQEALLRNITQEFATKYQLLSLHTAFVKAFEREDVIFLQTRGFIDTKVLAKKDAERDKLFRFIKLTIRSNKLSIDKSEAEAAEKLAFILKPYGMVNEMPHAENTAQVSDLVKKLESDDNKQYVETLGLTQAVAALKNANIEFDTLYSHRADEKRIRSVTESMEDARKKVDATFLELSKGINAIYAVNALTEKDAEKEEEIGAVIDAMNAAIMQFAETLSRRGVGKKTENSASDTPVTDGESSGGDSSDSSQSTESGGTDSGNERPEIE